MFSETQPNPTREMTIQEWFDLLPTAKTITREAALARTDEEKKADLEWHEKLFEGADSASLICGITYMVQVLKDRDRRAAIYTLESLLDVIQMEEFPPALRKILKLLDIDI